MSGCVAHDGVAGIEQDLINLAVWRGRSLQAWRFLPAFKHAPKRIQGRVTHQQHTPNVQFLLKLAHHS